LALSRLKHGFNSPRERQHYQGLTRRTAAFLRAFFKFLQTVFPNLWGAGFQDHREIGHLAMIRHRAPNILVTYNDSPAGNGRQIMPPREQTALS
jgi:hypothetical protein